MSNHRAKTNLGGSRPGAGRPREIGVTRDNPSTKAVRVPYEYSYLFERDDFGNTRFQEIMALINDFNSSSHSASETSPRWEKLRQFLSQYQKIVDRS